MGDELSRKAFNGMNEYRASKGKSFVEWSSSIGEIAVEHAQQMARWEAPFSHDSFDQRVARYPMYHLAAGENLARCQPCEDPADCGVKRWINSPERERNMVDDRW